MNLENKRILLTGGAGFFGRHVVSELEKRKPDVIVIPRSKEMDLRNMRCCLELTQKIDLVIHLAGHIGGIGLNLSKPGELFYDNAMMGLQMIEASRINGVQKVIVVGTSCSYPKLASMPLHESCFWDGYPEESNGYYGMAKKMLLVQLAAYRKQYGMNGVFLLPVNLYGPHDNFSETSSHVIPALIQKIETAMQKGEMEIPVWGDGSSVREFLYVEDAARGLVLSAEFYDEASPINLGSGQEISIKALAEKIACLMGYKGKFVWDATKPQGQPRRCLDTTAARREFGFEAKTSFDEGLAKTIAQRKCL